MSPYLVYSHVTYQLLPGLYKVHFGTSLIPYLCEQSPECRKKQRGNDVCGRYKNTHHVLARSFGNDSLLQGYAKSCLFEWFYITFKACCKNHALH